MITIMYSLLIHKSPADADEEAYNVRRFFSSSVRVAIELKQKVYCKKKNAKRNMTTEEFNRIIKNF